MNTRKQSRKQNRTVLAVLLIAILACLAAFAATFMAPKKTVSAAEDDYTRDPVATVYLGGKGRMPEGNKFYYGDDNVIAGWQKAVDLADQFKDDAKNYVKVVLLNNWTAGEKGFDLVGGTTDYFSAGRLYVKPDIHIMIDLNGHNLDRNLSAATANGHVLLIEGKLAVQNSDTEKLGKITGAHAGGSGVRGGGVYINGGTFNLLNGWITGNKLESTAATHGSAVYVAAGTFNMSGGVISENEFVTRTVNGYGTVSVFGASNFNMSGGIIENSVATYGAGVTVYNCSGRVNISGESIIRNNKALNPTGGISAGGAIAVIQSSATVNMSITGGKIYNNRTESRGGAMYVQTTGTSNANITLGGDVDIHHNVAASVEGAARSSLGGGITLYSGANTSSINVTMEGGSLHHNFVIHSGLTGSKDTAEGGGVYIHAPVLVTNNAVDVVGCTFTLKDGSINNNQACTYVEALKAANAEREEGEKLTPAQMLDEICDNIFNNPEYDYSQLVSLGYSTFSGGVRVDGTFIMEGGEVRDNTANSGGAINMGATASNADKPYLPNVTYAHFHMSGGALTGNYGKYGGGIYVAANSDIQLSGKAVIDNNYSLLDKGSDTDDENKIKTFSNLQISSADSRRVKFGKLEDGANIHIYVNENLVTNGQPFTQGYGENNRETITVKGKSGDEYTKTVYVNPSKYIHSDTVYHAVGFEPDPTKTVTQYIVLFDSGDNSGELGMTSAPIKFSLKDKEGGVLAEYEYGEEDLASKLPSNYIEYTYGDENIPYSVSSNFSTTAAAASLDGIATVADDLQQTILGENPAAGLYVLKVRVNAEKDGKGQPLDPVYVTLTVLVQSKELTDNDVDIIIKDADDFTYDGNAKMPTNIEVNFKDGDPLNSKYFEINGYDSNINAGEKTAVVIVKFKEDYCGTANGYFTIRPQSSDETSITTVVTWQKFDSAANGGQGAWVTYNPATDKFTYSGANQGGSFRAYLTQKGEGASEDFQTVYAKGVVAAENEKQNTSMWLLFQEGEHYVAEDEEENAVAFLNAGTYSVHIKGYTNYPIDNESTDTVEGLVIEAMELNIQEAAYENFYSGTNKSSALWTLYIESQSQMSNLLDKATYVDPSAAPNAYGERITKGEKVGAYARYRETGLEIVLNPNYELSNVNGKKMTLGSLLAMADDVRYVVTSGGSAIESGKVAGELNKVTTVHTTAVITFGNNYKVVGNASDRTVEISWTWSIVTVTNTLRTESGSEDYDDDLGSWTYGDLAVGNYLFRPEHGRVVIYSYYIAGENKLINRFALVYSNNKLNAAKTFYGLDANGDVDYDNVLGDELYMYSFHPTLAAGNYRLVLTVPEGEGTNAAHEHWWELDEISNDYGTRTYELTHEFTFKVNKYSINNDTGSSEDLGINVVFPEDNTVVYNGSNNNFVKPIVTLNRLKVLVEGVDYTLSSATVNKGMASLTVTGINSLSGSFTIENAYEIVTATNGWADVPSIMNWTYNNFDKQVNLITATPYFPAENNGQIDGLWFSISYDSFGEKPVPGLEKFVLDANGQVPTDVAAILNGLDVADYYLSGTVEEDSVYHNYTALTANPVRFHVFVANNSWEVTPTVKSWTEGKYKKDGGNILVEPTFGTAHIVITGSDKKVYYDNFKGIDRLAEAKNGTYTLVASVEGTDNYTGLFEYTHTFSVFKKPGLPWWATLLIAIGAVGLGALVLFILWKAGVFAILTEKIVVAIRTRASVDATIAAVRAAKKEDEARKSIAAANARERAEARRLAAQAERELPPEERAAAMEAKAKAQAEKAEKMRLRAEKMQEQAEKVRQGKAEEQPETPETPEASDAPETPAETPTDAPETPAETPTEAPETPVETPAPADATKETAATKKSAPKKKTNNTKNNKQ